MAGSATHPLSIAHEHAEAWRHRRARVPPMPIGVLLAAIFLLPAGAHATSGQGMIVMQRWKSMDTCATQAQRAFPDFTAEANSKRDAKLKECLAGQNLPPREGSPPPR